MDLDFNSIVEWFEENKEWMLIPLIVCIAVVILGIVLLIITGKDVSGILKMLFIILIIGSPVLGYYLGDYIDPWLAPIFASISGK